MAPADGGSQHSPSARAAPRFDGCATDARVNGLPADEIGNDRFDTELASLVEDFQRRKRLAVDGIAGVQTLVALDAALNDASTPFLHAGSGS